MSELDTLLNVPTEVAIAGKTLQLTPIRFGELAQTLALAGPLLTELAAPDTRWIDLILRHSDLLLPLAAQLSRQPQDWVASLALDDAADLLGHCVAVNADFFSRRLAPMLVRQMSSLTGAKTPAAPTQTGETQPLPQNGQPAAGPGSSPS